jgi:hypothetical protein
LAGERVVTGSAIFCPEKPVSLEDLLTDAMEAMAVVEGAKRAVGAS